MMKVYPAFTREIDNGRKAVAEILAQLNPEQNALENTVGFIHMYYEFVDTGVCQAIMDALPFEVTGCVSSYNGTGENYGDVVLSVTMLTSDTCRFVTRAVEDVNTKSFDQIAGEVKGLLTEFSAEEKPKLVVPYILPLQGKFSGDDLVETANALPDPLPLFGTVAFNTENSNGPHYVVGNGAISSDQFIFTALYGDYEPKFRITSSFAFDEEFGDVAEITEADRTVLKMVNGITALEYLKKQGMIISNNAVAGAGIWAVPAILTYPNGIRVVRGFMGIVDGTEHIFATGYMEKGAKITFAFLDGEKTLSSAEKLFKEIIDSGENGLLAYSCAARAWSLGTKYFAETERIIKTSRDYERKHNVPLDYCVAYSGGEICPMVNNEGKLVNVLHNYTLVSCAFC